MEEKKKKDSQNLQDKPQLLLKNYTSNISILRSLSFTELNADNKLSFLSIFWSIKIYTSASNPLAIWTKFHLSIHIEVSGNCKIAQHILDRHPAASKQQAILSMPLHLCSSSYISINFYITTFIITFIMYSLTHLVSSLILPAGKLNRREQKLNRF